MIRGFADAGRLLDEPKHVQAAARAAEFVLKNLQTPQGRLQRSFAQGQAHLNAYLDDYAFLVDGLLALHEATGEERWLLAADELTKTQIKLFWDQELGGFFFTSDDHEELLARSKDPVDSAQPSGNAVSASNLVYLGRTLATPRVSGSRRAHDRGFCGTAQRIAGGDAAHGARFAGPQRCTR